MAMARKNVADDVVLGSRWTVAMIDGLFQVLIRIDILKDNQTIYNVERCIHRKYIDEKIKVMKRKTESR